MPWRPPGQRGLCSWCSPTLSSQPSHCLWTPYTQGMVAGSFTRPPLQLQPVLSKFLSDARWRNNSSVKGKKPMGH